jgi:UPF0755 protein
LRYIFAFIGIFFFLLCIGGIYLYSDLHHYAQTPRAERQAEKIVEIRPGQGFSSVLTLLQKQGIVKDPLRFRIVARLKGYDRQIKAGEYRLSLSMSPLTILKKLSEGKVYLRKFTIPEGYTIPQIAKVISDAGLGKREDLMALASQKDFLKELNMQADSLEGYLFPDTYFFPGNTPGKEIFRTMFRRFRSVFRPEWEERAKELGFTVHEIVTLAAIIEKESGNAKERPLIASVFHNRLKRKMRLQSDPTVIYGIADFDGNLTRKHLNTHTPYNTYRISGLPPGPIACPGEDSLKAALWPAESRYLYFVSKGDGSHEFTTNLKDHNRAVRKFQLSG